MQTVSNSQVTIFDGRSFAQGIEAELALGGRLKGKQLVIIQADGSEEESTYVRLKREMGERLGVRVVVKIVKGGGEVKREIVEGNKDSKVSGVLVQLPIDGLDKTETQKIVDEIEPEKDVDGLGRNAKYLPAAVVAIEKILDFAKDRGTFVNDIFCTIGVVGSRGAVGRQLVERLRDIGYVVAGFDQGDDLGKLKMCDVVISVTGVAELIKPEMVMEGVVAIDVGYPKGDFEQGVMRKAKFFSPVPGGVGPVTVACLFTKM